MTDGHKLVLAVISAEYGKPSYLNIGDRRIKITILRPIYKNITTIRGFFNAISETFF